MSSGKAMKIAITGISGRLGRILARRLHRRHTVVGVDRRKLAGVPPVVVARAKSVLAKLEAGREATGGLAAGLDDLPLFAAAAAREPEAKDELRETLQALDVDNLSPRDALDALYRLKAMLGDGSH